MSSDVYVWFPDAAFPLDSWREIMRLFRAHEHSTSEWDIAWSGSRVEIGVWPPSAEFRAQLVALGCAPPSTRWAANLSTSAGRSALSLWIQFAVPYYTLRFTSNVSAHFCETPNHEGYVDDPTAWVQLAARIVGKQRELIKVGLQGPDGMPLFDAPLLVGSDGEETNPGGLPAER